MPIINENEYAFTSSNRTTPIRVREWIPEGEIKCVLQITHGVAEHIDRYADFARFLASGGFAVVGNDLLGHGKSIVSEDDLGFFGERDGWQTVVDDMEKLRQLAAEKWPGAPYFLLGHSMGSFLARTYLIRFPDAPLNGVILSGTGRKSMPEIAVGLMIGNVEIARHGSRFKSKQIDKMASGLNNNSFEPRRTDFDWISSDEAIVDSYVADPLCGFMPTVGLYKDMALGLAFISQKKNLAKMNKQIPVLFLSGDLDPIGANGTGVEKVYKMFAAAGMNDVFCKLYKNGRHEMLNEPNKAEVYSDIQNWISSKIR